MRSAAAPASVHVRAPGKINVFLAVGDVHDDGYHSLATVFQAVSLYEDVIATASPDFTVSVSGPDVDPATVPLDDRNLAVRAAKILAMATLLHPRFTLPRGTTVTYTGVKLGRSSYDY
ncbi:hypothetical protein [Microbacterium keratanolyticum]|uniref:hypothetical protein n=1 Tax=Microbacterium keratanolyticum TaxID=67574 RepID=UPI003631D83C